MGYDLFLAHASADAAPAEALYDLLARDVTCFLDTRSIELGAQWDRVIPAAQRSSRATVVLASRRTETAFYLRDEIASGIALQRAYPEAHRVIPVYLDGMPSDPGDISYGLHILNALDVPKAGGLEAAANRLRQLVQEWRKADTRGTPITLAAPAAARACPPASLHQKLCRLLEAQFETLLLYAELPTHQIRGAGMPLASRAYDVVILVQQGGDDACRRVCEALAQVAPGLTCDGTP